MSETIISLLNEEQKKQLLNASRTKSYLAGESLFSQGDSADCMFFVDRGKVSLYRLMPSGDEKPFKVFMAGDFIAEIAMFMQPRVYPMSARIEQNTELLTFSYRDIQKVVSASPELSIKVMEFMSNKIKNLMDTIDILTQVNANQRLVMKLADLYRTQKPQQNRVSLPVTKRLLATQLGMTPETLSRTIKKLKIDGLIVESGSHITVVDIPALCELVGLTPEIFTSH